MTGDAVRWTQVLKDGGCNPGCEGSPSSSQISETSTHSPGVGRDSSEHSHEPQASLYPGRKPQQQPQRMHHRRQPFLLSLKKILPIVLRLLSHCQTSTKRLCRSTASAMSSVAMTASSFHSSSPRAGSTRRGFYTSLLIVFQVVAFSSSFVIVSAHAATDDLSTSIKDNDAIGAQTSVFGEFAGGHHDYEDGDSFAGHYTPTWAVHIPEGDIDGKADQVARDHGFINLGKIFDDHYHFHHNSVSKRSVEESHHHQKRLVDDDRVRWSKQQQIKSRKKRDFIRMRPSRTSSVSRVELNDPKWPQMWYLNRGNGLDMNVIPAWEQGITGKGVVVTILDDGLESDHPDLEHNYDPKASYDVNSHDDDPMPHYDMTDSNRHGTRCAGEVAATANNSLCSVGIAFGARVGGVRMLDGDVTDAVEARSLSLNPQHIDIYSASWGPDDDGKTVDGPGELATRAFIEGVTKGRNGRGSIFIWASGNGGRELDNCNCDGYTNSIWTLSISSATEEGHVPWYSEKCSSTLATTYSSGGQNEKQVVTTDLHHSCTTSHTGTSASAPLAAGIVALVLEANRNLTWRDLQHIVVRTAKPGNLKDPTWITNGVGRRVSHSFGYGLLDAAGMVNLARTWQMVPEQQRCEINAPHVEQMIPAKRYITLQLTVKHCMGVNFLEHVQAKISLTSQRRGDIVIYLQSPSGTRVTLLTSRVHDVSRSGFNEWPFMSVHTWGEAPHGNWLLEVHNEGRFLGYAVLKSWSLIFYGTAIAASKNDPISVRPTEIIPANSSPPISFHHQSVYIPPNMNKYPVSVFTKPNSKAKTNQSSLPNSGNSGRKQQQQNHKISPYGTILSTPKKNGKNSKNNPQNNGGKSNSKGSSSNRPSNSQNNNQQSGKNNFYRVQTSASGGKSSTGIMRHSSTTTSRPKFGNQQSAYNANAGSNRGFSPSSSYKPEKSRVHEKVAIKAPKQIKDNNAYRINTGLSTPTAESASVTPSHTRYEPNPRIPKLFQQYDKIEQIFPEFHPYTGGSGALSRDNVPPTKPAPNKKQYPYYPNSGTALQESNTSNNRGGGRSNNGASNGRGGGNGSENGRSSATSVVVVTNPKPSRENSKKFSSTSSSSSFSSSSFSSASSSQNFQNEERDKQTEGMYIPNRKNTKAQITQWDLIFYGTDKPPQPDDPIQIKPGPFGSYGGDIDNNFLVPETMGQWRDLQQVGESHVDVQRTTNDQTNTACTNFLADQRCIECMQGTFLYNDRCWTHCPEQSYMVPEVPRNFNKDKNNDDDYENLISVRSISNTKETGSEPSPPRRAIMKPIPQKKCASCHTSCLLCRGPEAFECLQCHPGYHLTIISSDETYCYPATNGNNLSRATGQLSVSEEEETENILDELKAFWSVVVPALVIMLVVLGLSITSKQIIKRCKRRKDHPYERVAFEIPHEEVQGFNKPELHQPMRHKRECPDPSVSSEKRILVETSSDSDDC